MSWLFFILIFICLVVCWLLISPLLLELDTRDASISICWVSIGKCSIYFKEEWWLQYQVFFYQNSIRLLDLKNRPQKSTAEKTKLPSKKPPLNKMIQVLKTFTVKEWQLAADTGDVTWNARLFPLNFLPAFHSHLHVNFADVNYLYLKIINRPWKMIWAYLH